MSAPERDVQLCCELAAPAAEAWPFLVTCDGVAGWLGRPSRNLDTPGPATVTMRDEGSDVTVHINVERVDPPYALTFLWQWPGEPASLVELHLDDADSGCVLELRHARLDAGLHEQYRLGWGDYLAHLAAVIDAQSSRKG
jgi:uncharacterized protein YndB with AHSA1/START domain